jgi:hypothetical protein
MEIIEAPKELATAETFPPPGVGLALAASSRNSFIFFS